MRVSRIETATKALTIKESLNPRFLTRFNLVRKYPNNKVAPIHNTDNQAKGYVKYHISYYT